MLQLLHDKTIDFGHSVLGFEQCREFKLMVIEEVDNPIVILQSVEDENIGFIVASPFHFFSNFEFELEETDINELEIDSPEQVLILGIITLHDPFQQSTMNLAAPLIINIRNMKGKQIVLSPKYEYTTKMPMFTKVTSEGGE